MANSLQLYTPTKPTDSGCLVCCHPEVSRRATLYWGNQEPICEGCYKKIHLQAAATDAHNTQPHHRSRMENSLELLTPRKLTDDKRWCSLCSDAEVPQRATLECPKYGPLCRRCYKNIWELWEECKWIGRR
ncbi:uncharacterized protein LOC135137935 [Zophobas morio]|uniref:uncharacterized protein LOC135137875 n=1 Tax=Zophobas morio TaxID=2755281 RepID=UPI003083AA95